MTMNVYTHVNAEEEQKETLKFDTYFDTWKLKIFEKNKNSALFQGGIYRKSGSPFTHKHAIFAWLAEKEGFEPSLRYPVLHP